MSTANALQKRISIRAFLPTPVPREVIHRIFSTAQLSPSSCNTQPWQVYIVSGELRNTLEQQLLVDASSGQTPNPDFVWSIKYEGEYRDRQIGAAAALYGALGIGREDRDARVHASVRNWSFFGAPHFVIFAMEKSLGMSGAVDLGIYAQSVALLMADAGIGSCFQGALNQYPAALRSALNIPDHLGILFGMSFGYADSDAPANTARTQRESFEKLVTFSE